MNISNVLRLIPTFYKIQYRIDITNYIRAKDLSCSKVQAIIRKISHNLILGNVGLGLHEF